MDIKQLLNPPSRSAGPMAAVETPKSHHVDAVAALPSDSSLRNRFKGKHASACSPVGLYSQATTSSGSLNLETATTARSSISSYSSIQSYPTMATSPSSTTTANSSVSYSPVYIPGSNPYAPVFKVPNYNYSPTLTSPMSGPPTGEPLTPLGSDCSPSRVMSSYFPLQPPFQRRISASAFENSDSLTALAALATEDHVVVRNEDDDVVDAAEVLTGRRSSKNSLSLCTPKKLRSSEIDGAPKFKSMPNVAEHPSVDRSYKDIAPHVEAPSYSPTATGFVTPSPERVSAARGGSKYDKSSTSSRPAAASPDQGDMSPTQEHAGGPGDEQTGDNMPKCSYIPNCSTSSPLRKVVSHIFGRNKLSTRQIPPHIWVYYCRKHYQRSRYRNPKGFAKLQCELVRKQVERLINWGGVSDWVIKVRRREEMRLSREGLMSGPTSPDGDDDAKHFPNKITKSAKVNRKNWLVTMTGAGKTHHDIRNLLSRIEEEVHNGGTFPDVEILPNVIPSALEPLEEDQSRRRSDSLKTTSIRENQDKSRPVKPIVPKSKKRKRSDDDDEEEELPEHDSQAGGSPNVSPMSRHPAASLFTSAAAASGVAEPTSHGSTADQSPASKRPCLKQAPVFGRNKRKASRSPSPAADPKKGRFSQTESHQLSDIENTAIRSRRPRTLKPLVRQQDALRGGNFEGYSDHYHYPHSAPIEVSHDMALLPPPLLEDTLERQRRRSSTDTSSLHSYAVMRGGMGSRLGSFSKPGIYGRNSRIQDHSMMFATPPPSASSFSGRSSAEPDEKEFDPTFKGFSFDNALGGDVTIDPSKHVRDYISGFAARRATRMQEIDGLSVLGGNKQAFNQPGVYSLKRKYHGDDPMPQHEQPTSTPRHLAELPAEHLHQFDRQSEGLVSQSGAYHAQSAQRSYQPSHSALPSRKRAASLSPAKQMVNQSQPCTKRRRRASSVGPTRKKSGCASVAMKRTRTLPANNVHGVLDCIRVRT